MRLRRLALAAALLGCVGTSCQKEQLPAAAVPDEGVTMLYDLTPGQTYDGHVKQSTVVATPMGNIDMRLEYDLAVIVTGNTSAQGPLVAATFNNIKANAIMPGGIPAAAAGFDPEVAKSLNGVEMRFNLSEGGEIENMPELPEDQPPTLLMMLGQLTGGVQASFMRLPEKPLKKGDTWTRERNEDGTTSKMNGKLKKFAANGAGESIAVLETDSTGDVKREVQGQKLEGTLNGLSTIEFVTSGGYASSLQRKIRQTMGDQEINMEFDVTWTKGEKKAVEMAPEVQAVTDPCDADYVGGEECPSDAPEQAITDPCDGDYVGPEPCEDDAAAAPAAAE